MVAWYSIHILEFLGTIRALLHSYHSEHREESLYYNYKKETFTLWNTVEKHPYGMKR